MYIHEQAAVLMAKERMEGARRSAERARLLRLARPPRGSARVRLGITLVRLGHWIQGRPSPTPGAPVGPLRARS